MREQWPSPGSLFPRTTSDLWIKSQRTSHWQPVAGPGASVTWASAYSGEGGLSALSRAHPRAFVHVALH